MMRSLYSAVSGLKGHQTKMDVIGHNIANVNTYGYKSARATFADALYQNSAAATAPTGNRGGVNAKQVGLGMSVSSIDTIFTDNSTQATGKNTDVALTGDGLFVVKNNTGTFYTRDGNFAFDAMGNYVNAGGYFVQGWMATNGELSTTGEAGNIQIPSGKSMDPSASSTVTYTNNLNSNPAGGKVSSVTVTYKDGTTASVQNYKPGAAIFVHITTPDGVRRIKADSDVGHSFTTGAAAGAIYKSKVSSITATGATGTVDLNVSKGTYTAINGGTANINIAGVQTGTYSIGSNYTATKTIQSAVADPTNPGKIVITFVPPAAGAFNDGITSVTIPDPGTGVYTPGKSFTVSVPVVSGVANANSKATMENGETETMGAAYHNLATANMDGTTVYNPTFTANTASVERNESVIYHNNKEVNSVNIALANGSSYTANIRQDYAVNEDYYPPMSTTITVYDSLGNAHAVPILVGLQEKDSVNGNKWVASLATSVLSDGTTLSMSDVEIQFDLQGRVKPSTQPGQLTLTYANGADSANGTQNVSVDFSALTQYAGSNTISATTNGYAAGTLQSLAIDSSGTIVGVYSNGQIQNEAQIAVAQFNNAAGLTRTGGNLFQVSNNSGVANVKTAGDLGVTFTPGALEMSGVDTAEQFTEMITTQRGYQANSKIITVDDEMLETVINMKR